ncbi:hypothetical protein ACHAXM_000878 [Skeletonema potamos]
MPKLTWTLKRITLFPPEQPIESPKAKAAAAEPSQKNDMPALVYYSQLTKADEGAATTTTTSKSKKKSSSSAPS